MIRFFYIIIFFLVSCEYPDIDSVPSFERVIMTKEEAIDLCKISNSDNEQIIKCLEELNQKID